MLTKNIVLLPVNPYCPVLSDRMTSDDIRPKSYLSSTFPLHNMNVNNIYIISDNYF